MVQESYQVKVPGSLMLFGEHAVLHGKQAIVCAIDHYIEVTLLIRPDKAINITSAEFGEYSTSIDNLSINKPYDYALTAINQYAKKLKSGFDLYIKSDFPPNIGFGSSAAVTVAVLGILALWLDKQPTDLNQLHKLALKTIRLVHGVGSGADVAASVFGGVVAYKIKPIKIEKLNIKLPLTAMYCGFKTPTYKVIAQVEARRAKFKHIFADIYKLMDNCSRNAIEAIKNNDLSRLGELMNINQGLQDAIGVNNQALAELIFKLRADVNTHGAKISGSGLGDCIVGLGRIDANKFNQETIDLEISQHGFVVK